MALLASYLPPIAPLHFRIPHPTTIRFIAQTNYVFLTYAGAAGRSYMDVLYSLNDLNTNISSREEEASEPHLSVIIAGHAKLQKGSPAAANCVPYVGAAAT